MAGRRGEQGSRALRGLNWLASLLCHHRWIRARWEDGSYGYRCAECLRAYPRTWNDLLGPAAAPAREAGELGLRAPAKPAGAG